MRTLIFVITVLCAVVADFGGGVLSRNVEAQSKFSRLLRLLKKDQPAALAATTTSAPSSACTSDQFQCANAQRCIPRRWVCDGDGDCSDRSDEANCVAATTTSAPSSACTSDQFQCANAQRCIPRRWVCDGSADCLDGSDENSCDIPDLANCGQTATAATTNAPSSACTSDQFQCANAQRCIPRRWVCDGDGDCSDRSDEANCGITEALVGPTTTMASNILSCTSDQFQCSTRCIPSRWRCDGDNDCSDGSDEAQCDADIPDCEEYSPTPSTDVQTTPTAETSFGEWLANVIEELFGSDEADETSTSVATETSTIAQNVGSDDEDTSGSGDGSGDDDNDTDYYDYETTRAPKVTTTPKKIKEEVSENDVLEEMLEALSRFGESRFRAKRAASAVGYERRRRCKVSKRQHKNSP